MNIPVLHDNAPRIRQADEKDLDSVLLLYSHLLDTFEKPADEVLRTTWCEIQSDPRMHFFILETDGTPVSMCVLSIIPNLTYGARPYALIENVVTRREYRNHGYGTALLVAVLNYAWQQRCYKVMLLTGRKDPAVYRLYEKAGFVRGFKEGFIAFPPGHGI
jgi:GNAT superfamily N-acetyltransferase